LALSIAEIIIIGLFIDFLLKSIKIPGLIGMLLLGTISGPYVLNILSPDILTISSDLRMIALIVILLRAGFELSKDTLNKVGKQVLLLSFIPAIFEGIVITALAPRFLNLTYLESAMLGAIIAAVSPAVVVPLMIKFIDEKRGTQKGIPTLVLAASSIDDIFVIVIYSVLIGVYTGKKISIAWTLATIPICIVTGIVAGLIIGWVLYKLFEKYNPRATKRVLIILAISIILVRMEPVVEKILPFAALLAIMSIGFIILEKRAHYAHELSEKLSKVWLFAEIILFTLVGAQVNVKVALSAGASAIALIFLALIARSIGTYLCLFGSNLNIKEKIFVVISYIPKATVQAAIGGAPLIAMKVAGLDTRPGEIILAVAVLSILLTAPIGAWAISFYGNRYLEIEEQTIKST
jgi:NhaP-type Na+/H+ or K+/H+ antiporter